MATNSGRVEVLRDRAKLPADGKSPTKICVRFPETPGAQVTLRVSRGASFEPDVTVTESTFTVTGKEVNLTVYPPRRPRTCYLSGPGFKHRLDFVAVTLMQGLIYDWIPTLFFALLFALVIRSYAVASYYIPSASMEDTLRKGDLLIADKFSYKVLHHKPMRGDVVIFQYPENRKQDYIKRTIGLPGDTVEVRHGVVYVNGEALDENYIKERPDHEFGPTTVPSEHYFMMGDNRNHSSDSRVWGFVPRSYLEGRALFVFWPPTRMGVVEEHEYLQPPAPPNPADAATSVP
jgi:signal peptidase I